MCQSLISRQRSDTWEKYTKQFLPILDKVIPNSEILLLWVQSRSLCFLTLFSQYFSWVGFYSNGDIFIEIVTQKFPRKPARLLLISGFPSPEPTFCSRQAAVTNADGEVGGAPLCTSLLPNKAKKQQQFWHSDTYWTLKGGKFLQRPALQRFVMSSFYSFSGICIRAAVHFKVYFIEKTMAHIWATILHPDCMLNITYKRC